MSYPGVQRRRSYSRLHAIIADSASFANSADRFANNFASDSGCQPRKAEDLRFRGLGNTCDTPRDSRLEDRVLHFFEPMLDISEHGLPETWKGGVFSHIMQIERKLPSRAKPSTAFGPTVHHPR